MNQIPNGTLVTINWWGSKYCVLVINSWMVNPTTRLYALLRQNGVIIEDYYDKERWDILM